MKKLLLVLGLTMFVNSGYSQVSVDDDEFSAFVKAQNEVRRESDSLNNLKLITRIEKFDSVKVAETPKPIEKPKVIKKEPIKSKPVVVAPQKTEISVEPPAPIKQPFNQYYIEDNYQITGNLVYSENMLIGIKFETVLRNKDYVLLKLVKKNVALNNPNKFGDFYIGSYFIPIEWWNNNNTSGSLTYEQLEYIKDNYQIKYKN